MQPPWLVIRTGNQFDHALPLGTGTTTVGRSRTSHVRLDHISVSRHHAVLAVTNGTWLVRDLGSHNGTFVNRARIQEQTFALGARLRFGEVEMLVVADERAAKALLTDDPDDPAPTASTGRPHRRAKPGAEGLPVLSPAERVVFDLLLDGFEEKQIAAILGKQPSTVHNQVQHIYKKLGVHSRIALLVQFAGVPGSVTMRSDAT